MPKFNLTYGLKGQELKKSSEDFRHLGEAMEKAQARALAMFKSTKLGEDTEEDSRRAYPNDPITALGTFMMEASNYIDFFAEEIFSKPTEIYIVTKQLELFDRDKFTHISLEKAVEMLNSLDEVGIDTETNGLDCHTNDLLLIQLGIEEFQVVVDLNSFDNKIPQSLRDYLNSERTFILQNAKFDLQFLFTQDVIIKKVYDTMLVETIITNGLQFGGRSLDAIVSKYCGVTLNKDVRKEFTTVGITDRGIQYAADDVKYLPEVKKKQLEQVEKFNLQKAIDLDNVFVIALAYTEYCGIKLDYDKWLTKTANRKELLYQYKKEIDSYVVDNKMNKYLSGMYDMFNNTMECTVNWNSPVQVKNLFKDLGINVTVHEKGKTKETINAKVLKPQVNEFPILEPYLKYKEMQKEVSTYGESWKKHINPKTGRIHTNFWQLNDTGRLSSGGGKGDFESVNLQNIPGDAETRACFVAEPGNVLIDADYSAQEQIILANFSKEPKLLKFYADGFTDMHSYVAFLMYEDIRRCTLENITPDELQYIKDNFPKNRTIAKNAGFAINYGGNGKTIAKGCNISDAEGEFVYKSYFEAFPEMSKFFTLQFDRAAHFGYIEFNPVTKRKFFFDKENNAYFQYHARVSDRYFWMNESNPKEIYRLYNAAKGTMQRYAQNYPMQGTAADITKFAAVLFLREILKRGWWMKVLIVNQVHDELLVECPKEISEVVSDVLIDCMERAGAPFCRILPLKSDTIIAEYWKH